ncbi:MAG: hypothetical protein K6G47_06615 [Clostridia bacterium]|nr:hypothetical protein [Clostridia bacterium]
MKLLKNTVSLLLSAVVVTCMGSAVFADSGVNINQTFKDANFRTYLKQYDKNANGSLDDSELKNITSICCTTENKIKDVSGIERLKYCTDFSAVAGEVVDVDLSKCTNIKNVSIFCCSKVKSFKAGSDLEYLEISHSSIETLDLSCAFYLETIELRCNDNLTGKVDLTRTLFLKSAMISSCPVTSIEFCKASRLSVLEITATNVSNLDLRKITGLDFTLYFFISSNSNLRSMSLPSDIFIFNVSHMKNGKTSYIDDTRLFILE